MSSLKQAAQDAIFATLNVPTVTNIAPVFQHVPDDQDPPVVIIGDISSEDAGGKDGDFVRLSVEIITLRREPAREALFELMEAVRGQLKGVAPASATAILSAAEEWSEDDDILDDGNTYMGTQRFSLFAQPAD